MKPLVVIDADVLGRRRTGDETHVRGLLRALAEEPHEFRLVAVTRHPELVPRGIEAVALRLPSQELRMAFSLPRLLRRLRPALAHFQHALPLAVPCRAVVTVHDLSFERDPTVMRAWDRAVFRRVVPRAVRRARCVLAVSERTRRDLEQLYGVAPDKIVVTPNGVDPEFTPGDAPHDGYLLFVGAVQPRKEPLAAVDAARAVGLPLVVAGPAKDEELARELSRRGADVRGYVTKDELVELYRGAAALVFPSRYEGFGLPVLEAMAAGTPVVAAPDEALREVAGDAAVYAGAHELPDAIRRVLADRDRYRAAGIERARLFSWRETARRTLQAYREALR